MAKSCETCAYFEARTKFCRRNPPVPIQATDGEKTYMTSTFPKIQMPQLDFCAEHKTKTID